MSPDELSQILDAHGRWVRSEHKEGERANLKEADLQGADLEGTDLRGANLRKANLQGAQLWKANLEEANLYKAQMQKAELSHACLRGAVLMKANLQDSSLDHVELREADLTGADLTGANLSNVQGLEKAKLNDINLTNTTGLLGNEFAGADITGAKLPEDLAKFDGLNYVEATSRQARSVFLAVVGGCVYAWLTIATTTDAELLVNTASTPLPIIQTTVPIAGFYWAAPLILLGLYLYLHLYLQGLWEALARLPAIFPDGSTVDERSYPWLLMSLARAHVPLLKLLKRDQSSLWWMRVGLSLVVTWGLVPFTLFLLWVRYLPRHESVGIIVLIASFLVATWSGIFFYRLMRATLRRTALNYTRRFPTFEVLAMSIGVLVTAPISYATIASGTRLEFLGYGLYANLTKEEIGRARLEATDLRFAEMMMTKLGEADLAGTNLEGANLQEANLKGAFLKGSQLKGAILKRADLTGANLKWADLSNANFGGADLEGASLKGANLQGAGLADAKLMKTNLKGVNLKEASLHKANLTGAKLDGANLEGADLREAKLSDASFGTDYDWSKYPQETAPPEARTQAVNMRDVDLAGAQLQRVDLSKVQNLTQHQLEEACGDRKTKLPEYIRDFELDPCPAELGLVLNEIGQFAQE